MSSALKDIYSPAFYKQFCNSLKQVIPDLEEEEFLALIFEEYWPKRELKDRMRYTATILHQFMPADFTEAVNLITQLIQKLREAGVRDNTLEYMFLPDYIEQYGLLNMEASIKALETVTQFTSCEFAVRPFLLKYPAQMMAQMQVWSVHENVNVRRFASEGMRPRLPWAMAVPALKKNPQPILPILENLKNDPSEFVRRSVANNINDIAKDHPAIVLELAKKWKGVSTETDKIIRHGCRTLLKQGHPEILTYFNLRTDNSVVISDFKILTEEVKAGEDLIFTFSIQNNDFQPQLIRLEYGLYYNKANGKLARKVFKISEKEYKPGELILIRRKQSFRYITTRKYYTGLHKLSVIVNGQEKYIADFKLVA